MSTFLIALSTGLHLLATVVFVGYYLFTDLIYLPVLERQNASPARATRNFAYVLSLAFESGG